MLLALALVVGVLGGNDGQENIQPCAEGIVQPSLVAEGHPTVLSGEPTEGLSYLFPSTSTPTVAEALDVATPDSILRGRFVPDIRVAGSEVVVDATPVVVRSGQVEAIQGDTLGEKARGTEALPERGLDGQVFYISIYCCLNDSGGAYCGTTASGVQVFPGAVACDPSLMGRTVRLGTGDVGRCVDTGSAVHGAHLDWWFYDCGIQEDPAPDTGWWWLRATGTRVMVEIVR